MVDLTSRIIGAESGGDPFARNPRSSAGGSGQFLDKTWLGMLKKHRPDLAAGKSDADLLRLKFDPALSREMTSAYASDNQNFLRSRGLPTDDRSTYLAHFAGPGGASAVLRNPQAPASETLGQGAIAANPFLANMTGNDVINWAGGKVDPARAMAASIRQRFAPQTMGTATEGGVTAPAPAQEVPGATDRLKAALTKYDQDWIDTGKGLQKRGQEIATSYGNRLGAYGGAGVAALGGFLEGMEGADKKAHDEEFSRQASDAKNTEGLMNVMLSSSDPKMREAGIELKAKLLTPKATEWASAGDGFVMNKATGETRAIPGFAKPSAPVEVNGRLVQRQPDGSFKEVYAAPPKPEGLRDVAPGTTVFDPNSKQPVYTAPQKPEGLREVGPGSTVYDPSKGEAVFTAPEKPQPLQSVAPGSTVFDPNTREQVFSAPPAPTQPTEIEKRALAAGLKPGTPEFSDYVLKGPRDQALTDYQRRQIDEAEDYIVTGKAALKNLKQAIDLSSKAYSGPTAGTRGYITSQFGDEGGEATEQVHNLVGTQAVGQLKSIFGGNPTEGERAILLELQGSVNQAPKVREEIWGRAMDLIENRMRLRQTEADQIRSGTYYRPGGGASPAARSNPDQPTPVTTETIDPASGQPRPAPSGSAPAPQTAAPPSGALTKLLQNPTLEMQTFFDQKYGAGAAARALEAQKTPTPAQGQGQPLYGEGVY